MITLRIFQQWIEVGIASLLVAIGSAGSLMAAGPLKGGAEKNPGQTCDVFSSQGDEWIGTTGPDSTIRSKFFVGRPCPRAARGWHVTSQTSTQCYYGRDVPGNPGDRYNSNRETAIRPGPVMCTT